MAFLNKIFLIGNVGSDPEMRFTPKGSPVTSFRLATNRVINSQEGERKQETEWFTVVAWNKQAELCNQYVTKGQRVFVEGRLQTRTWDGQDGQKRFVLEVVANQVKFLDRPSGTASLPPEGTPGAVPTTEDIEPDELPF
jgi:single-strand DNA-binding protein